LNKVINSKITQTGNFINPSNRTFRIEAPLENFDNKIKQNLDAKMKVNIYKNDKALAIPLRIVREDASGRNYIYKMAKDVKEGVFITSKQYVVLGNKNDDQVEIIEGIAKGDIVVLEGAYSVEDSQRVKLID